MKKVISMVLTVTFIFSMFTNSYAGQSDRAKFITALQTTFTEVKRETAISGKYSDTQSVLSKIIQNPYQYLLEFSANYKTTDYADKPQAYSFSISNNMLLDMAAGKMLNNTMLDVSNIPELAVLAKLNVSIYLDKDKIAFDCPKLFNKTVYLDKNTTAEQWNNSQIGKLAPITMEQLNALRDYAGLIQSQSKLAAMPAPTNLMVPYTKLFLNTLNKADFKSQGAKVVASSRGDIYAEKITATITTAQLEELQANLITQLNTDKDMKAYLDKIYAGYDSVYSKLGISNIKISDQIMGAFVRVISNLDVSTNLNYSIYISKTGYAISNEFSDEYGNVTYSLDFTGAKFLLDEITLNENRNYGDGESSLQKISMVGNNVSPINGIFNSKIYFTRTNYYSDSSADQDKYSGQLYWDTKKTSDNFYLKVFHGDIATQKNDALAENQLADFKGTYLIDKQTNIIEFALNNSKIDLQNGDEPLNFSFRIKFAPVNGAKIVMPNNTPTKIVDLTLDDLSKISNKLDSFR